VKSLGGAAFLHCQGNNVLIEVTSPTSCAMLWLQLRNVCRRQLPTLATIKTKGSLVQVYVCYNERLERTACSKQGTCKTTMDVQYLPTIDFVEIVQ